MKKIFLLFVSVFISMSFFALAFAEGQQTPQSEVDSTLGRIFPAGTMYGEGAGSQRGNVLPSGNFMTEILPQLIKILLMLAGTVSFVVFVYAGVMLVIAQGKEEDITKFKNVLIWSLVGLALITTSYAIVSGILQLVFK